MERVTDKLRNRTTSEEGIADDLNGHAGDRKVDVRV